MHTHQKKYRCLDYLLGTLLFVAGFPFSSQAQINQALVVISFNHQPTSWYVYKAPLKYNKKFAMSMQIDDGTDDIFTHAFPVFEGGLVNGTTYPGITYTDGCGHPIHFKMSSSVFSFNGSGNNGPDIHLPGNGYGKVTWPQMDTLYKNNWGILNHGINGNSSIDPVFMNFSIKRDQSYIRRKLYQTTEGGVITHLLVNPDGHAQWTQAAFDLGYRGALNQNNPSPLSEHGGNVNDPSVSWTQPQNLYRVIAEDINVPAFAQALADSSSGSAHYWGSMFTHSVVFQYNFSNFVSDFTTIGNLYGSNGQDNIFMAGDEEIVDYLLVRDTVQIQPILAGSTLFITFTGAVPHDLRYYALSLVVESNATITNISVTGIDSVTQTGIGTGNALINLNWDEHVVTPPEVLADSFTTIAIGNSAQFDCWIAEDYVITMDNGNHKDSLRQLLCAVPNTVYDSGFCDCSIALNQDTTLMAGACDTLYGTEGDYNYEWYVADTLYDTTQNIYVCPADTTVYHLVATNSMGCPAEDSITVNINFLSVDLGPDTTLCAGNCVTLSGPPDMAVYDWIVADTTYDTVQTILACPMDTTQYILIVTDSSGNQASDTLVINVLPAPQVDLGNDTALCLGDSLYLQAPAAPAGEVYTYLWNTGDTLQSITVQPDNGDTTYLYFVDVSNGYGCTTSDTINITVYSLPACVLQQDTVFVCKGNPADFFLYPANCSLYIWTYGTTIDSSQYGHLRIMDTDSSLTVYLEVLNQNGCSTLDSAYLQVFALPTLTVTNDTAVCSGDSLSLSATGASNYLWRLNGDSISNHSSFITSPPVGENRYTVAGSSEHGCSVNDTVIVTVNPLPFTQIIYDTTEVCTNTEVVMYATGASHYRWEPGGDTTIEYAWLLTDTTTFYLVGTTDEGCTTSDSLTINAKPVPAVSFTGLLPAYCQNDPDITLTGIPEAGIFSGAGIVGNLFSPSIAGAGKHLILFSYTNEVGCMGIDSARTTIYGGGDDIILSPANSILYPNDSVLFDAGPGFDHYYWSTGDTTQTILLHYNDFPNGTYNIIVIGVINSCTSRGTTTVTFAKANGISEMSIPTMVVYPNPNKGSFTVAYAGNDTELELRLKNSLGQSVFINNRTVCSPDCHIEINLPQLKPGIYFVQISTASGMITRRVVVR